MSNKTINGLDPAVTVTDSDLIAVWQGTTTRKTSVSALRTAQTTSLPFSAITGAPDDNTALKAQFDALEAQIAALEARQYNQLLGFGIINPNAPTAGADTVFVPFPAGFNGSNSAIFVSPSYAQAGGNGTGLRFISSIVTIVSGGWNVTANAMSENGIFTVMRLQYQIWSTTGLTPGTFSGAAPAPPADPPPGGGGGGVLP